MLDERLGAVSKVCQLSRRARVARALDESQLRGVGEDFEEARHTIEHFLTFAVSHECSSATIL